MIITRDFTYLHFSKTGGTFVSTHVRRTYGHGWESALPKPARYRFDKWRRYNEDWRGRRHRVPPRVAMRVLGYAEGNKHGTRREIPTFAASLPTLSTIRNPMDRYASLYEFGWWRDEQGPDDWRFALGRSRFSHFPDLSFPEYLSFTRALAERESDELGLSFEVGIQTVEYIKFFARDLAAYSETRRSSAAAALKADLDSMDVIHTESVGPELADYLRQHGIPQARCNEIVAADRVVPRSPHGVRTRRDWREFFDERTQRLVEELDVLLFDVFPEYAT